jgi:preprotein translocase subunit YajC
VSANFVLFLLLVAAFYLLVLAPARNKKRREADIKDHLRPGVEVITKFGMFGRVDRVVDGEMFLEIAPGVTVRVLTGALHKILMPKDETAAAPEAPEKPYDDDPPAPNSL